MAICELSTKGGKPNWCERHQQFHIGVTRDLALDPGKKGEFYRQQWDTYIEIREENKRFKQQNPNARKIAVRTLTEEEATEALARGIAQGVLDATGNKPQHKDPSQLLPCVLRGEPTGETRECRECAGTVHIKVLKCEFHGECTYSKNVGLPTCIGCRERVAQFSKPVPKPNGPIVQRKVTWCYGITTVPARREDLLPRTLQSLKAGGFGEPHLFVDGTDDLGSYKREFGLEVTGRTVPSGLIGNWITALWELWVRNPQADRYVIFQDDIICYKNLRQYLEHHKMPDQGYWNLYSWPSNEARAPRGDDHRPMTGWHEGSIINDGGDPNKFQHGKGALGLVFSRDGVKTLLASSRLVGKPLDARQPTTAVDGAIVGAMNSAGFREYVHFPSLLQHTGINSTKNHLHQKFSTTFLGDRFDAMELIERLS